ncbi:MAG: alpha-galactosidase [Firmicutes bacterium]|nr:alpha-galactosidase [Bacillota bacterium]
MDVAVARSLGPGLRWTSALLLLLVLGAGPTRAAAPSVVLTSDFPGMAVEPGATQTISLTLANYGDAGQVVDLQVLESPEGWDVYFRGRGTRVHQAYVPPREESRPGTVYLDLQVNIPRDAAPSDYPVVLAAGSSRLRLSLRVSERAVERPVVLTTDYPQLRGPAGAQFEFPVQLANRSGEDQTYQLDARAPEGWRVEISPRFESRQVASIGVRAGATQSLDVRVTPPSRVPACEYPVLLRASAVGSEATLQLTTVITGTYELSLTTPSGRLNAEAVAGRESPVKLRLDNTGSADLHGITLSASTPINWQMTFDPDRIDVLPAGQSREVTATLRPDGRAIAGDYAVTVRAMAAEAASNATLRVAVKTPTLWGWVGVGIVAVVVAGLFTTFRVYGRR